ncbi:MAG: hypothetical protein AB7U63_20100 [Porticoccaceae bacterium]
MGENQKVQEWKTLLCQVNGILSAHIVLSDLGEPAEIHVLATTDKRPKAIARDVQSALMSKYGLEVDHQIISIAQIRPEMAERLGFRLVFSGVETKARGSGLQVLVDLARNGHQMRGEAKGSNTAMSRRRCVAQATLNAIQQCVPAEFELTGVEVVNLFGRSVIVSQVYSPKDDKCYVGSAVSEADQDVAVIQSVLSALNRRIAILSQDI